MNEAREIEVPSPPRPSWWRRWFVQPILKQLTQGITCEKLAWTIGAGAALGIFPIMGTTSVVCFIVAWALGLNQPVIQVICHALWPAHLALILVFIKAGQWLHGADPISFSISELLSQFFEDPWQFAQDFGLAAWHGIVAWAIVALPLVLLVKFISLPLLRRAALKIERRKGIES